MKQIISVGIGQCGIRLAADFYQQILSEHSIDKNGQLISPSIISDYDNKQAYFSPIPKQKYMTRMLLVDSDHGEIDQFFSKEIAKLSKIQNCIYSNSSTCNNYAKGFHEFGDQLNQNIMDAIRRNVEPCDSFQMLQIFHSIGGGTGSGLASKILVNFHNAYPNKIISNFTVTPSQGVSDIVTEPYNAALALNQLNEHSNCTILISNESLLKRQKLMKKVDKINYKALNKPIVNILSDCTVNNRYNSTNSSSMRKILTNLCPFPFAHFLSVSLGAYSTYGQFYDEKKSFMELIQPQYSLSGATESGVFVVMNPIIRGNINYLSYNNNINLFYKKLTTRYPVKRRMQTVEWFDNLFLSSTTVPRYNEKEGKSVSLLYNNSNISTTIQKISQLSRQLSIKKAFIHHYINEGISLQEIKDAENQIQSLATQYSDFNTQDSGCYQQQCDDDSYC